MNSYCESVQNLASVSCQQKLVSTEAVLNETVVNGEDDDGKRFQCWLIKSIPVGSFYSFQGYRKSSRNYDIVIWSIMHLACSDAW